MTEKRVRVLVVDDSAVVRGLVARALEMDPGIVVSGTAMNGELALSWLKKHDVDVVVMDVEMPIMCGLEALKRIQVEFPDVHVIMASSLTYEGAETTFRALELGAVDCIAKPQADNTRDCVQQLLKDLVPLVKALGPQGTVKSVGHDSHQHRGNEPTWRASSPPQAVVIGSSTGGPNALTEVLTGLPADFPLPIFIVQHMPPMFTSMLGKYLARDAQRPCFEATNGQPVEPNTTYIAPGGHHMMIAERNKRLVTVLNENEPEHFCRPSVNPLFRSAAQHYGESVLAVMLTGMGEDGIEGTRELVDAGATMIAQDEATSVVWGMPGAVVREGLASQVLPLPEIAGAIYRVCLQKEVSR